MTVTKTITPPEPLNALADFAFDWAETLCDPEIGCTRYHKAWSMVRLIEADAALPAGFDFFQRELSALASDGRIRILLSGAADTGLAAMVLSALRPLGIEPEITLVDRCRTTLEQNRLFAEYAGFSLTTLHQDAADVTIDPVDAVIVHSFLGFFAPEARQGVVNMWARNLAPAGRVLMSNRLTVGPVGVRPQPSPEDLAQRAAEFAKKLKQKDVGPVRAAAMTEAALELWRKGVGTPQLGEQELTDLLTAAGLSIIAIERDRSGKTVSPMVMKSDALRRFRAELSVGHRG